MFSVNRVTFYFERVPVECSELKKTFLLVMPKQRRSGGGDSADTGGSNPNDGGSGSSISDVREESERNENVSGSSVGEMSFDQLKWVVIALSAVVIALIAVVIGGFLDHQRQIGQVCVVYD